MSTAFYVLTTQGPMAWGLAESALINGFEWGRYHDTELLWISRTGPFMPPITMPGVDEIIVSDEFRAWVTEQEMGDFQFSAVEKKHIVDLDWVAWSRDCDSDITLPRECDVEEFLKSCPHSHEASDALGLVWEWIIAVGATIDVDVQATKYTKKKRVHLETWNGQHIFSGVLNGKSSGWVIVDQYAKTHLHERFGEFLNFEECLVK